MHHPPTPAPVASRAAPSPGTGRREEADQPWGRRRCEGLSLPGLLEDRRLAGPGPACVTHRGREGPRLGPRSTLAQELCPTQRDPVAPHLQETHCRDGVRPQVDRAGLRDSGGMSPVTETQTPGEPRPASLHRQSPAPVSPVPGTSWFQKHTISFISCGDPKVPGGDRYK